MVSLADAWNLLWTLIAAVGGIGALTVVGAGYVSKIIADRSIEKHKATLNRETERLKAELVQETETHKLKLKKQEIFFSKQIEAVGAYLELHRKIRPGYNWPDKDWSEACSEVVEDFGKVENLLQQYLEQWGPVLDKPTRKKIRECAGLASTNKFASDGSQYGDRQEAEKAADKVLTTLEKLEEKMIEDLQS